MDPDHPREMQEGFAVLTFSGDIPAGLRVRGNLDLPTLRLKVFQIRGRSRLRPQAL